jgi:GDP-4-dehydro-6-deoxy-D-mannose reductase
LKALITGASGFVAGHLAREFHSVGWRVDGVSIGVEPGGDGEEGGGDSAAGATPSGDGHFSMLRRGDVTVPADMRRTIDASLPDAVVHLAGVSSVGAAERDPVEAFRANALGVVVLLREVLAFRDRSGKDPVCLVVGSAEQYGRHPANAMPLDENTPLRPITAYAASKCAQEVAALQIHRAHDLRVICVRSFNHSGAGQRPDFLLPALVRRAIELRDGDGNRRGLAIGNLSPIRDYLHVEDVARAYRLLVERGVPGEVYNVSSGRGVSVEQVAGAVLNHMSLHADLDVREELVRPVDIPVLAGNSEKLSRATGWQPTRTLNDIIEDLIIAASK